MSGFSMGVTPKRRVRAAPFRPLRVFGLAADPATRWVRIVLAEKLQHDAHFEAVDIRRPPEDLIALNPGMRLPMLLDREVCVVEAGIIVEYLNERFPHPPLMPSDPAGRARMRLLLSQLWQAQARKAATGKTDACRDMLLTLAPLMSAKGLAIAPGLHLGDTALAALLPGWLRADMALPASLASRVEACYSALMRRAAVHSVPL